MDKSDWKIHPDKEETRRIAEELKHVLAKGDFQAVLSLLSAPMNMRSLVVRRGIKSEYLKLLLGAFLFLLEKEFGDAKIMEISGKKLIGYVRKIGIPEKVLAEILAIAFHLKNEKLFEGVSDVIMENEDFFRDREVPAFALNAYGAWLGSIKNEHEKNLEYNKRLLAVARKNNFDLLECKAVFALSDHKAYRSEKKLKPKNQIEDYKKLSQRFSALGVDYDALRCDIELAVSFLNLAKKQEGKIRGINLEKASNEAKEAQKKTKKMGYPNALIKIKNVLSEIYKEKGNKIQSKRYMEEAEKLKEKYY